MPLIGKRNAAGTYEVDVDPDKEYYIYDPYGRLVKPDPVRYNPGIQKAYSTTPFVLLIKSEHELHRSLPFGAVFNIQRESSLDAACTGFIACSVEKVETPCYQSSPFIHTNPVVNLQLVIYIDLHLHSHREIVYPEIHFYFSTGNKAVWRFPDKTKRVFVEDHRRMSKQTLKDVPDTSQRDAEYAAIKERLGIR